MCTCIESGQYLPFQLRTYLCVYFYTYTQVESQRTVNDGKRQIDLNSSGHISSALNLTLICLVHRISRTGYFLGSQSIPGYSSLLLASVRDWHRFTNQQRVRLVPAKDICIQVCYNLSVTIFCVTVSQSSIQKWHKIASLQNSHRSMEKIKRQSDLSSFTLLHKINTQQVCWFNRL